MRDPLVPLPLQAIAVAVLLTFLLWVVHLVRRHRLPLRDSLLWLLSTGAALLVTLFPGTLRWFAHTVAIEVPSNGVFALAFVYVFVNLLSLTIAVSGNAARVRRLSQECALLRAELDEVRRREVGLGAS
jgi:hypothetical protein